jgi:tetratricopeptide (TPR) repeat protein
MNIIEVTAIAAMILTAPLSGSWSLGKDGSQADELFKAGKIMEAREAYLRIVEAESGNIEALEHLAGIYLLENKLEESERYCLRLLKIDPNGQKTLAILAEIYYRRLDFRNAAEYARKSGQEARAVKLEAFGDLKPYEFDQAELPVEIPFVRTDPLPVVKVSVNGSEYWRERADSGQGIRQNGRGIGLRRGEGGVRGRQGERVLSRQGRLGEVGRTRDQECSDWDTGNALVCGCCGRASG